MTNNTPTNTSSARAIASAAMSKGRNSGREQAMFAKAPQKIDTQKLNNVTYAPPSTSKQEKTITVEEALKTKTINEMSADELNETQTNKVLTAEEANEIENRKDQLNQNKQNDSNAPVGGQIKNEGDYDDEQSDDEKFDIQQGDFIDFLMKEIVLASAAWAGKKISGQVNLALYKSSSWVYHHIADPIGEGWEDVKDWNKARKERAKKIKEAKGDQKVNFSYIENAPKEYQNIYNQHNKEIDDAVNKIDDADVISRLCEQAIYNDAIDTTEKNGKPYWIDKETQKKIPLSDKYIRSILTIAQNIHHNVEKLNINDEEKKKIYQISATNTATVLTNAFSLRAEARIFASNMATAQMVQDTGRESKSTKSRETYLAENEKQFFIIYKKLRNSNGNLGDIKKVKDIVSISHKARTTACNNQKEGKPDADNKYLATLNSLTSPQERSEGMLDIYSAAMPSPELKKLQEILTYTTNEVTALENAQAGLNSRRAATKKARNGEKQPAQTQTQTTPPPTKGRENG
ncbi:MAG: hypothetical protein E7012_01580 [Alphaproteobacteria bacterium]|nr:hypothetical protein [Alphaproteobacteria bacterium]